MAKRKQEREQVSNVPAIQQFFDLHGEYVTDPKQDLLVFEDGATCERQAKGFGLMVEPPDDEWERLQLAERFYRIKAKAAVREYDDFYNFLMGNGVGVEGVDTEEEKLAHLKKLQAKARSAQRRYYEAQERTNEVEPHWVGAKRREETDRLKRRSKFQEQVKKIKL
ncbi:MAG: hypothetical protein AB7G28_07905 [Pirellulales bacterium]